MYNNRDRYNFLKPLANFEMERNTSQFSRPSTNEAKMFERINIMDHMDDPRDNRNAILRDVFEREKVLVIVKAQQRPSSFFYVDKKRFHMGMLNYMNWQKHRSDKIYFIEYSRPSWANSSQVQMNLRGLNPARLVRLKDIQRILAIVYQIKLERNPPANSVVKFVPANLAKPVRLPVDTELSSSKYLMLRLGDDFSFLFVHKLRIAISKWQIDHILEMGQNARQTISIDSNRKLPQIVAVPLFAHRLFIGPLREEDNLDLSLVCVRNGELVNREDENSFRATVASWIYTMQEQTQSRWSFQVSKTLPDYNNDRFYLVNYADTLFCALFHDTPPPPPKAQEEKEEAEQKSPERVPTKSQDERDQPDDNFVSDLNNLPSLNNNKFQLHLKSDKIGGQTVIVLHKITFKSGEQFLPNMIFSSKLRKTEILEKLKEVVRTYEQNFQEKESKSALKEPIPPPDDQKSEPMEHDNGKNHESEPLVGSSSDFATRSSHQASQGQKIAECVPEVTSSTAEDIPLSLSPPSPPSPPRWVEGPDRNPSPPILIDGSDDSDLSPEITTITLTDSGDGKSLKQGKEGTESEQGSSSRESKPNATLSTFIDLSDYREPETLEKKNEVDDSLEKKPDRMETEPFPTLSTAVLTDSSDSEVEMTTDRIESVEKDNSSSTSARVVNISEKPEDEPALSTERKNSCIVEQKDEEIRTVPLSVPQTSDKIKRRHSLEPVPGTSGSGTSRPDPELSNKLFAVFDKPTVVETTKPDQKESRTNQESNFWFGPSGSKKSIPRRMSSTIYVDNYRQSSSESQSQESKQQVQSTSTSFFSSSSERKAEEQEKTKKDDEPQPTLPISPTISHEQTNSEPETAKMEVQVSSSYDTTLSTTCLTDPCELEMFDESNLVDLDAEQFEPLLGLDTSYESKDPGLSPEPHPAVSTYSTSDLLEQNTSDVWQRKKFTPIKVVLGSNKTESQEKTINEYYPFSGSEQQSNTSCPEENTSDAWQRKKFAPIKVVLGAKKFEPDPALSSSLSALEQEKTTNEDHPEPQSDIPCPLDTSEVPIPDQLNQDVSTSTSNQTEPQTSKNLVQKVEPRSTSVQSPKQKTTVQKRKPGRPKKDASKPQPALKQRDLRSNDPSKDQHAALPTSSLTGPQSQKLIILEQKIESKSSDKSPQSNLAKIPKKEGYGESKKSEPHPALPASNLPALMERERSVSLSPCDDEKDSNKFLQTSALPQSSTALSTSTINATQSSSNCKPVEIPTIKMEFPSVRVKEEPMEVDSDASVDFEAESFAQKMALKEQKEAENQPLRGFMISNIKELGRFPVEIDQNTGSATIFRDSNIIYSGTSIEGVQNYLASYIRSKIFATIPQKLEVEWSFESDSSICDAYVDHQPDFLNKTTVVTKHGVFQLKDDWDSFKPLWSKDREAYKKILPWKFKVEALPDDSEVDPNDTQSILEKAISTINVLQRSQRELESEKDILTEEHNDNVFLKAAMMEMLVPKIEPKIEPK